MLLALEFSLHRDLICGCNNPNSSWRPKNCFPLTNQSAARIGKTYTMAKRRSTMVVAIILRQLRVGCHMGFCMDEWGLARIVSSGGVVYWHQTIGPNLGSSITHGCCIVQIQVRVHIWEQVCCFIQLCLGFELLLLRFCTILPLKVWRRQQAQIIICIIKEMARASCSKFHACGTQKVGARKYSKDELGAKIPSTLFASEDCRHTSHWAMNSTRKKRKRTRKLRQEKSCLSSRLLRVAWDSEEATTPRPPRFRYQP